jgi:hypothetical protein
MNLWYTQCRQRIGVPSALLTGNIHVYLCDTYMYKYVTCAKLYWWQLLNTRIVTSGSEDRNWQINISCEVNVSTCMLYDRHWISPWNIQILYKHWMVRSPIYWFTGWRIVILDEALAESNMTILNPVNQHIGRLNFQYLLYYLLCG